MPAVTTMAGKMPFVSHPCIACSLSGIVRMDLCEAHWRWREIAAKCLNSTVQYPLIELAVARRPSRSIGEKPIRFINVMKRPRLSQEKTYCAAVMSCQEPTSPAFSGV